MDTRDQILERIKKSVVGTAPTAILVLFGSYARGTNTKDSDIDLLILVKEDKLSWPDEKRITYPLYDIEFETGTRISPVIIPIKEWESKHKITPFYNNVVREGIVL